MNREELNSRTRKQLLALAKSASIPGRHRMTKAQLSEALVALFSANPAAQAAVELPSSYGRSYLTLLEINPSLAHAFWELTSEDSKIAGGQLGSESAAAAWTLRLRSVTSDDEFFDVRIDPGPGNWYVHHPFNGMACWAEIGLRIPSGRFVSICRSNSIGSLRCELSESCESQWLRVGEQSVESAPDPTAACAVRVQHDRLSSNQLESENPKSAIRNPQSEQPISSFGCGLTVPAGHRVKA